MKSSKQPEKIGFQTKPDITTIDCDYIGPPDKLSNLRPVLRHQPIDETAIERELRLKRIATEEWNQQFWSNHNQNFFQVNKPAKRHEIRRKNVDATITKLMIRCCVPFQQKQDFIRANKQENEDSLSADKMSEFYKSFLDSNWKTHFNYNREW